jgi:thymidylate synthase
MSFVYQPLHKPNQLIRGTGKVAVVTGWLVKEIIANRLDPGEYAAIGQLYSPTRGIDFLVRNLLFNPQVRFLVILNATKEDANAGGCQCLWDFFQHGFSKGKNELDKECWAIASAIPGYIDIQIPQQVLEGLRTALTVKMETAIASAISQIKLFSQLPSQPWTEPQTYPKAEAVVHLFPGVNSGHRIEGKTIAETWIKIIQRIRRTGKVRPTAYDNQWQELINLMAIVTDEPQDFFFPEPNYLPVSRDFLAEYIALTLEDTPFQEGVKYSYGNRMRSHFGIDQISQAIQTLSQNLDSTRVVISLWDAQEDSQANSSPPCLNHIWLRVREYKLILTATFRSNDMFSAWVANAFGLRALQQYICDRLVGIEPGELITISQSAHIYDDCWESSDRAIGEHYLKIFQKRDYSDPAGSFVISLQNSEILVEHLTTGTGVVLDCFSDRTAKKLYQKIAAFYPALEIEHALYLGTELQKAETALQLNLNYHQDRGLNISK